MERGGMMVETCTQLTASCCATASRTPPGQPQLKAEDASSTSPAWEMATLATSSVTTVGEISTLLSLTPRYSANVAASTVGADSSGSVSCSCRVTVKVDCDARPRRRRRLETISTRHSVRFAQTVECSALAAAEDATPSGTEMVSSKVCSSSTVTEELLG